ncbi:MAG: hypothetical protein EXR71_06905 [Myxococcales bacterium]|nr:hypothetical protein [Myxococcales bacterium]
MRRHLVAAFVLWHALAMLASSLPSPGRGVNRSYWSEPTVQAEFQAWADVFGTDMATFQDGLYVVAVKVQWAVRSANAPFREWLWVTNTVQSWKMFVAPHRFPTRLQLRAQRSDRSWAVVYEEGDDAPKWRGERFATERMRAAVFAWGWPQNKKRWASACSGFAREYFAEVAEAEAFQCRFGKGASLSAAQVLGGETLKEEWVLERTVQRPTAP